jgi:hypothetical protein
MAMRAIKNAVVITGKFRDNQTGQEKSRYQRIGILFKDDETNEVSLKLEALPLSNEWTGWVNFYDRETKQVQQQVAAPAATAAPSVDDFEDDIPF